MKSAKYSEYVVVNRSYRYLVDEDNETVQNGSCPNDIDFLLTSRMVIRVLFLLPKFSVGVCVLYVR
jgi:hypothetical protein